jgi:hypothetical protein
MIEVEGMTNNHAFTILIDSGDIPRRKHGKYWLVQMAPGAKRKVIELVKSCSVGMNGLCTKEDLNVFPLGSYDCLIGMDWLD